MARSRRRELVRGRGRDSGEAGALSAAEEPEFQRRVFYKLRCCRMGCAVDDLPAFSLNFVEVCRQMIAGGETARTVYTGAGINPFVRGHCSIMCEHSEILTLHVITLTSAQRGRQHRMDQDQMQYVLRAVS
jgi:hypothetical protein